MSANIYTGGLIGATSIDRSGIWGVGSNGLTIPDPSYYEQVLIDGAVAFWPLNETSGSTANDLAGSYDLTYNNAPTLNVTGPPFVGPAVTFNGSDENAKGDDSATFTAAAADDWSMEAWVKYADTGTTIETFFIIRQVSPSTTTATVTGALLVNNGTAGVISAQTTTTSNTILQINSASGQNDNEWHHVVATSESGGNFVLYIDGVSVASSSTARNVNPTTRAVTLASNRSGISSYVQYFGGSLTACAYYDLTLSPAQVLDHYTKGTS